MFGSTGRALRGRLARIGALAGLLLIGVGLVSAKAETRTLKIYHVHLNERSEITFKKNGRYLPDGLKKLNYALRDWRRNQPTKMDPRLFDLIWEAYQQTGSKEYINVIGGFRAPETNAMLRSRSSGVAEKSQHMLGKAMDFYIPGVPLKKLREIGLKMQIGGVGFYPRSGSPFVHFDVGNGRHWPRMSRKELLAVFPHGNTIHVPSDGKPLPGYEMALASYKKRKGSDFIQVANVDSRRSSGGGGRSGRTLLAALFGGGSEEAEDTMDAVTAPVAPVKVPTKKATAKAEPAVQVAAAEPPKRPAVLPAGVAMPDRDAFDTTRDAARVPVPPAEIPAAVEVAALEPARIPVPVRAPARPAAAEEPAVAGKLAVADTPAMPAATPADMSETLVAALEAEPAPIPSPQLAYSVPTPAGRPPFEAVLKPVPAPVASAVAAPALLSEAAVLPAGAAQKQKAARSEPQNEPKSSVGALIASLEAEPATTGPAMLGDASERAMLRSVAFPAQKPTVAASLVTVPGRVAAPKATPLRTTSGLVAALEAPRSPEAPRLTASRSTAAVDTVAPTGKAGRVTRSVAVPTPRSRPVELGTSMAARIEVASLVTDPDRRAEGADLDKPNARSLVTSLPTAVFTAGFVPKTDGPDATRRFSGNAVQFLPVLKLN